MYHWFVSILDVFKNWLYVWNLRDFKVFVDKIYNMETFEVSFIKFDIWWFCDIYIAKCRYIHHISRNWKKLMMYRSPKLLKYHVFDDVWLICVWKNFCEIKEKLSWDREKLLWDQEKLLWEQHLFGSQKSFPGKTLPRSDKNLEFERKQYCVFEVHVGWI